MCNNKKFTISGYEIILNQDNKDKEYYLVLVNKDTKELYKVKVSDWTNNTPYDLGKVNGKDYTNSWFKGTLDLSDLPNGDYDLYKLNKGDKAIVAYKGKTYTYKITNIYTQPKVGKIAIYRNYDKTTLTLITCTNHDSTTQTIYIAELESIE